MLKPGGTSTEVILDRFLEALKEKGTDLYPAQEEAILELLSEKNVILNTPTGSGKSLVALALHFQALSLGRRSFYTSPIKALVNEKFFALCREFGPEQVGMVTGDASVNPNAPILCCTAEILAMQALREGASARIDDVVMDEFHYYSDRDRGVAWQIPLLTLPQTRFLLMSATMGDTSFFEEALTKLNRRETALVWSNDRPVPLDFQYSELPLHETVSRLLANGRAPIYLVNFTQRECAEEIQNFMSVDLCTKEQKRAIAEELGHFRFSSPYGKELQRFLKHGLGLHHAGLLPKYRNLVERLAQKGLLPILFGTDTLGVGVNIPIRTVLMTKLCKYDGEKTVLLSVRDFQQISGRAGRKGYDDLGTVVVQAPEHLIENIRNEQKAAGDQKKLKKLVKKKPPEKGFLPWTQETFKKLVEGKPESLISRFQVNSAMLLQVLNRVNEDGCAAMRKLIFSSHESPNTQMKQGKVAFQLFRSLVDRKIIELNPLRVNVDLQEDFSLNHDLSLYLVDTIKVLDPQSPSYALDVLTLVESILENPDLVLKRQLDRAKDEKMREMKSDGVEYDDRMAELEKVEYPKPNRDFIYGTFNTFAAAHPWLVGGGVGGQNDDNIRPKSVAREIIEGFFSFSEYIREYDLQRGEGVLLRYLSDVYKGIVQNVPEALKNDEIFDMEVYLRTMLREVDSSLVEEWEKMKNPAAPDTSAPGAEIAAPDLRSDRALIVQIRNEVFRFVKCFALERYDEALAVVHATSSEFDLKAIYQAYRDSGHSRILIDAQARSSKNFHFDQKAGVIQQILIDPEEHNDWASTFRSILKRRVRKPGLFLSSFGSPRYKAINTGDDEESENVETTTPPITAIAMGTLVSAPGPKASAGESHRPQWQTRS